MRPKSFRGGRGSGGGGGGGSCSGSDGAGVVGGGRVISQDDPLLTDCSILPLIEQA